MYLSHRASWAAAQALDEPHTSRAQECHEPHASGEAVPEAGMIYFIDTVLTLVVCRAATPFG